MRTITQYIGTEELDRALARIEGGHGEVTAYLRGREEAIGYLSDWGSHERFPVVDIYPDDTMHMVAVYRARAGDAPGYVIGAVWRGEKFTFHS